MEIADKSIEKPRRNKPSENNQVARGKNNSSQPIEKDIKKWLVNFFQENQVKEISLKNGELVITHNNNNNEVISSEQANNSPELRNIQNLLQQKGIQSLDRQALNISDTQTPSNSQKPDYIPYLLTGAIGIGLISLVAASCYYLGKKSSKKNSY